jgi:D-lactate dehydrogenase
MKAVAYSIKSFEREFLAKANHKKHDITLISNSLSTKTIAYAEGKEAVIVFTNDDVSAGVIDKLAALGIKYIITRSTGTDQIDKEAAARHNIKIANVPSYSPQAIAEHAMALAFALSRHLIKADRRSHCFDFTNDELVGFNFYGKTVGLIGLGNAGLAAAKIFNGLGCKVVACDPFFPEDAKQVTDTTLQDLLASADIISLHLPLTPDTHYLINQHTLQQMKTGVMLINTSRGALINTTDLFAALDSGKIGYLGMDVYEHEQGLFFENHENDKKKDPLLQRLLKYDNVIITPHQAYLTKEALQEIADQTIKNLDHYINQRKKL